MHLIKYSEYPFILVDNIFWLIAQIIIGLVCVEDIMLCTLILIITILISIPILIYSGIKIQNNNSLVEKGEIIQAKINKSETKIVFGLKGFLILQLQCSMFKDGTIQIFKEQYMFDRRDKEKIFNRLECIDTVEVLVINELKKYQILADNILGGICNDTFFYCPSSMNYILLILNIGIGLMNIVRMLIH
ncbi:MAG: hypothetical protein K2L07_13105 [Lachnospiraceae bacterium]|nr:hypothetical protein [Lachnospiraceae bacterium]